MTIHLAWMRVTAAAATIATFGGQFAAGQGQYGPYATAPQYSTVAPYGVQPYQPTQPTVYPTTTQSTAPTTNYRTADRPEYAPAPQAAYATTQQPAYAPTAPASASRNRSTSRSTNRHSTSRRNINRRSHARPIRLSPSSRRAR